MFPRSSASRWNDGPFLNSSYLLDSLHTTHDGKVSFSAVTVLSRLVPELVSTTSKHTIYSFSSKSVSFSPTLSVHSTFAGLKTCCLDISTAVSGSVNPHELLTSSAATTGCSAILTSRFTLSSRSAFKLILRNLTALSYSVSVTDWKFKLAEFIFEGRCRWEDVNYLPSIC